MPEESRDIERIKRVLSKLTVKKLKALASKYDVDISDGRKKADYVGYLAESERLLDILKDEEFFVRQAKNIETIEKELDETGVEIEEEIEKVEELPNMVYEEADALLNQRKDVDIELNDLEDLLEVTRMRYEERNYGGTLDNILEVRDLTSSKMNELEQYLWAYSILASQRIIEDCGRAGGDIDSAVRLLLSAKESYSRDEITDNRDLIRDLQDKARDLLEDEVEKAKKTMFAVRDDIDELKSLGVNVSDSEELIQRALEAIGRNDHLRCTEYTSEAKKIAEESRARRIEDIKKAVPVAQDIIEEARELGSDVTEAEKLLKQAKAALKKKDYFLCSELTRRAESKTVEVQDTQIQKAMELRQRQMENISNTINHVEPLLKEAELYGLDVREAREMVQRANLALNSQDYVNGTLYVRNAEEIVKNLEPEIEKFRAKSEIPKPAGGTCSRCQSTNIKFFDNGWGKCFKCGNIFRWMGDSTTKKEKKGLLGMFRKK
jgi:hypothetical protein